MLCTEVHAHRDQICALEDAHAHTHTQACNVHKESDISIPDHVQTLA